MKNSTAFPFSPFDLPVQLVGILGICLAFIIFALLSIVVPLKQSSKIDPATAMSQVDLS